MLILGIVIALIGFIISYKGTFACRYEISSSFYFFITSMITLLFDRVEIKILAIIATLIIGLFFHYNPKSMFVTSKGQYIVFNIDTYELLNVLEQIIKRQNISCQITANSILLDFPYEKIINVKPKIFELTALNLSEIWNTDLQISLETELDIALSQITYKRFPLFGSIMLCLGITTIILFYMSIL